MKYTRPALRWHGGKWLLAPWIIKQFPPHRIYTEAYGGGASVLIRKSRAYSEVYNDLDGEVVNLFRVLQSPEAARLQELLTLTPFSRTEFERAYEETTDEVERARRLVIRSFMGYGSNSCNADRSTGFRASSNRPGTTPAHDWAHYPDALPALIERFRGVVIESRPAAEVLEAHDSSDTLHYVDPPYVHSARQKGNLENYAFEMSDEDHRDLARILRGLRGGVIVSGYATDLYDKDLFASWHRAHRAHRADGALDRTEVLWINDKAWNATDNLPL